MADLWVVGSNRILGLGGWVVMRMKGCSGSNMASGRLSSTVRLKVVGLLRIVVSVV